MTDDAVLALPKKEKFRVHEVALHCEVTEHTVRRWCQFGRLKYVKIGGIVWVLRGDLLAFIRVNNTSLLR